MRMVPHVLPPEFRSPFFFPKLTLLAAENIFCNGETGASSEFLVFTNFLGDFGVAGFLIGGLLGRLSLLVGDFVGESYKK